jgi:hypothetical protein
MVSVSKPGHRHRRHVWGVRHDEEASLTPVTGPLAHGIVLRVFFLNSATEEKVSPMVYRPRGLWARV